MTAVDFSAFVADLAAASGEAILPFFRTAIGADDKGGPGRFDPVTEADKAGEAVMRQMIRRNFPLHGIVGEEFGSDRPDADYCWVLDPIDGTRAFISGVPLWGTLIGLEHKGRPCYGMMHQPFTRETFFGDGEWAGWRGLDAKGRPAERRLTTRRCADMAQATLMTTSPDLFEGAEAESFARCRRAAKLTRYGGDCYAYCMLAAGHVDVVIETGLQPYDIVALIPIIEGAGGVVTNWEGGSAAKGGRVLACGDERLHEQAMAMLAKA
jgi:histidinol phosphatase-like enzyme (inositol monophosphatase family)